jgi:twitching motility two-component system response regulator PilG
MEAQAPGKNPALLREGVAAARTGDRTTARSLLSQVVTTQPDNELAWLWLASVADTSGESINCWRRALVINPRQEHARSGLKRLLLQEGISLARAGQKAQARRLLLEVSELDPQNEMAWLWLASSAETSDEAISYVRRVLQIDPEHARARDWLVKLQPKTWPCPLCHEKYLEPVEQCTACQAVLSLRNPEALLHNEGVNQPSLQTAIAHYESIARGAADFETHFNLGLAYLNLGRLNEGLAGLQEAGKLRPHDANLRREIESIARRLPKPTADAAPVTAPDADAQSGQRVVLVVDDSPTIRKLVTVTLEREGYRVLVADGGVEALKRLNEVVPDLILLDITMPHMDGYQLCRLVKSNEMTSKVPIVMLSGKDGFFDKVRGRMVGASEYVTKPFEPAQLLQTVERQCSQ